MNAQFQSLFENVCRCFGHTPTSRGGGLAGEPLEISEGSNDKTSGSKNNKDRKITQVNSQVSSHDGKRRTNQLKLNDKQYDELFEKAQNASSGRKKSTHKQTASGAQSRSSYGQPPRPDGSGGNKNRSGGNSSSKNNSDIDNETAQALAQAKQAANPPRYRIKRKRSSQTREEIFRHKNGMSNGQKPQNSSRKSSSSSTKGGPATDFSRLLNPSLALCFATPVRGTEEEQEEQDLKSVDCSDTATLNTNGEDTITSTLYFDSKYAHIQESTPPMELFNEFKLGQAKDEIRTIMATDSHSSVRMMQILQQQQHFQQQNQGREQHRPVEGDVGLSSNSNRQQLHQQERQQQAPGSQQLKTGRSSRATSQKTTTQPPASSTANTNTTSTKQSSSRMINEPIKTKSNDDTQNQQLPPGSNKKQIKKQIHNRRDEEMQDVVPDVKPLSSSTDSSRFSTTPATRQY
ncbi:unnamed protein product [Pseudo-nitzschia multistriata]|uniref:Uncharacterized protein n=1 Tax=Pseudo-nitzschia multistriata TaxID=183589 RepID=A0A448ZRL8_9STRA|nr:unnamed protein product [Pseudo-nitzschia multistriata]